MCHVKVIKKREIRCAVLENKILILNYQQILIRKKLKAFKLNTWLHAFVLFFNFFL